MEEIKPGYKSSEFYLTAVSMIVSLVYMSGVVHDGGATLLDKAIGLIALALSSLGYSVGRSLVKK